MTTFVATNEHTHTHTHINSNTHNKSPNTSLTFQFTHENVISDKAQPRRREKTKYVEEEETHEICMQEC